MQDEEIYDSQTEGEEDLSYRCTVQCSGRVSFKRFKSEGHGVRASYVRGRSFEQHRWIFLLLLKLS